MTKFEIGKTYTTRMACDHEMVLSWTVIARTAKQVTLEDRHGDCVRRGIRIWRDVESCMPDGTYSMAPCLMADRAEA